MGQLLELTESWNWEQTTGITVSETTDLMQEMFDEFSVGSYCMIGSLIHYVTNSPPTGVLLCDGTQYLRVDYPDLYADLPASLIIDADNFIVPDIQDSFLLAAGATYAVQETGGEIDHTLTVAEIAAHAHNYNFPNISLDMRSVGVPNLESASTPPVVLATTSTGGDVAHNNMPPYVAWKVGIVAR